MMATIINEILLGRPSTAEVLAQNETSKVNDSLTRNILFRELYWS
jgi:hypothetical protein